MWIVLLVLGLALLVAGGLAAVVQRRGRTDMQLVVDDSVRRFLLTGSLAPMKLGYPRAIERSLAYFNSDRFRAGRYWSDHARELREAAARLGIQPNCYLRDGTRGFWCQRLAETYTKPGARR